MEKNKKIISAVGFILSAVIFAFALSVFIITLKARTQNRPASVFGYSLAVVVTGSMSPEINVGDLIIVKNCDISQISVGENAVFMGSSQGFEDKCIVHKVVEIYSTQTLNGPQLALRTKGVANDFPDDDPVTAQNFLGKEVFSSAFLGSVFTFLQNPVNWLYLIAVIAALYVAYRQIKRIIKLKRGQPKP